RHSSFLRTSHFLQQALISGFLSVSVLEFGTMSGLAEKECVPCKGEVPPLKGSQLTNVANQLNGGWQVIKEHHLEKEYKFKDFRQALDFTNKVGELAESQGHHPDIYMTWGKVKLTIW